MSAWSDAPVPAAASKTPREQSRLEELANAASHGVGLLLAAVALPLLVQGALLRGQAADVVGAAVFGATMVVLYLVSTLYHALPPSRVKTLMCRVDHAAIYLFIAGSYMPFLLGVMRGAWGWALLVMVWLAAVAGITAKLLDRLRHPLWSTGLYVAMGWVALVGVPVLASRISTAGLLWLLAAGAAYTVGALVFLFDGRLRFAHLVFHLFVMMGTACHFCAALWHAIA